MQPELCRARRASVNDKRIAMRPNARRDLPDRAAIRGHDAEARAADPQDDRVMGDAARESHADRIEAARSNGPPHQEPPGERHAAAMRAAGRPDPHDDGRRPCAKAIDELHRLRGRPCGGGDARELRRLGGRLGRSPADASRFPRPGQRAVRARAGDTTGGGQEPGSARDVPGRFGIAVGADPSAPRPPRRSRDRRAAPIRWSGHQTSPRPSWRIRPPRSASRPPGRAAGEYRPSGLPSGPAA